MSESKSAFSRMMSAGFLEEVRACRRAATSIHRPRRCAPSVTASCGRTSTVRTAWKRAFAAGIVATRRLAKRQLTWLGR